MQALAGWRRDGLGRGAGEGSNVQDLHIPPLRPYLLGDAPGSRITRNARKPEDGWVPYGPGGCHPPLQIGEPADEPYLSVLRGEQLLSVLSVFSVVRRAATNFQFGLVKPEHMCYNVRATGGKERPAGRSFSPTQR